MFSYTQSGVDGLVISNTTIQRPSDLKSKRKTETGGLSGQPLKEMSTKMIHDMYRLTQGNSIYTNTILCILNNYGSVIKQVTHSCSLISSSYWQICNSTFF